MLLIVSLSTHSATARIRIWHALKTLGCTYQRSGSLSWTQAVLYSASAVPRPANLSATAWLISNSA